MRNDIQMSTTYVPMLFLVPHYGILKSYYETMKDSDIKKLLADILSVLAMHTSTDGKRESLKYKLLGSVGDIGSWGLEYVRNLTAEVGDVYAGIQYEDPVKMDLLHIVRQICDFYMEHNLEYAAVDLLMEVKEVDFLLEHVVNSANYKKTCLYLKSAIRYLSASELTELKIRECLYAIYMKYKEYAHGLQMALLHDDEQFTERVFTECDDLLMKKQLCSILARHGFTDELYETLGSEGDERDALQEILRNTRLNEGFLTLANDINVMEPKSPKDIYKAEHLLNGGGASFGVNFESARQNMASTFVNAFVNAGFGQDKLMTIPTIPSEISRGDSSANWVFLNKDHGKVSAAASLGMIMLWDIDSGLSQLDKYFHSKDKYVMAGALLGVGIVNCGVKSEHDPAMALLCGYVHNEDSTARICAIMGLGLAYAGSRNVRIVKQLTSILEDKKAPLDVVAFTAISLGLICVGSCNDDIVEAIISVSNQRTKADMKNPLFRFLPLAFGLLFLGKPGAINFEEVAGRFKKKGLDYTMILVSCLYAGTGDVKMVKFLQKGCAGHVPNGGSFQELAVLGIAMVAMGEELGLEMAIRMFDHFLKYGEENIRRSVPLALGLLCVSNPKINVIDTLSRLSHDTSPEVAMGAIISLGLIGAGTNNLKVDRLLRDLSSHYSKKSDVLFCVRIAQGLLHMGKGLMTLSPFHSDRFLFSRTALTGILVMLQACLSMKDMILGSYSYVLYFLALAMQPRMLLTVDEDLKHITVPIWVGQAVDVVAKAGQPSTIAGFQTHLTPILLKAGERAELADKKYIPLSPTLEGFVILKEDPAMKTNRRPTTPDTV